MKWAGTSTTGNFTPRGPVRSLPGRLGRLQSPCIPSGVNPCEAELARTLRVRPLLVRAPVWGVVPVGVQGRAGRGPPSVSSPGSFPNKAGICILTVFPISFSAPGTRKTRGGKGMWGSCPELQPLWCLSLSFCLRVAAQALPATHQPVGTLQAVL